MSGPDPGKKCVFPFTRNGKTFNACALQSAISRNDKPWCATKVDDKGAYNNDGSGSWGTCGTKCPFEKGKYYMKKYNYKDIFKILMDPVY